ncbi:hypothetical protein BMI86_13185 [Thioclava sp. DLFJ5-1]|uniref:DUF927 domain-containing protein n=1 Tax=Thioclava sp. DLFJ5-1 TaxID=1915314 RepID=UPI000998079F|nr:DUF927 domain-containing protein [Thioclava sp. DLFJ5-1]OOY19589.1 hypothetical protein BMI86_13185 [Thioclava sp. DLFJ5-1]
MKDHISQNDHAGCSISELPLGIECEGQGAVFSETADRANLDELAAEADARPPIELQPRPVGVEEGAKEEPQKVIDLHAAKAGAAKQAAKAPFDVAGGDVTAPVASSSASIPPGFNLEEDGLFYMAESDAEPISVCSPIRVEASFSNGEGRGWGKVVAVKNADGDWHKTSVLNSDLQSKPQIVIATLVDSGLELGRGKKAKEQVIELLKTWKPEERLRTVTRAGWVDESYSAFVIGDSAIGKTKILPVGLEGSATTTAGSVEGWKRDVASLCAGNHLMILAVSLSFAGPLLALLGLGGGGLHFRGQSSSGKTTMLKLAASVWGGETLIGQWRATSNGLEAIAARRNDMLLALDELAEIPARSLYDAIYMLANGVGKTRMSKDVELAQQARWRLALISSGEISIEEKLAEARLTAMAGHEVRLVDIEADCCAYGAFDVLHGAGDGAAFSGVVQKAVREQFGCAGREFVHQIISCGVGRDCDRLCRMVNSSAERMVSSLPLTIDGQVSRVAKRFAAIAIAGELATRLRLTGWAQGDATSASTRAFLDWYDRRFVDVLEDGAGYVKALQKYLTASLTTLPLVDGAHSGVAPEGWRDMTKAYLTSQTWTQLFPAEAGALAAKRMVELHLLVPGEEGRLQRKAPRAIPGRPRLYTVDVSRVMSFKEV